LIKGSIPLTNNLLYGSIELSLNQADFEASTITWTDNYGCAAYIASSDTKLYCSISNTATPILQIIKSDSITDSIPSGTINVIYGAKYLETSPRATVNKDVKRAYRLERISSVTSSFAGSYDKTDLGTTRNFMKVEPYYRTDYFSATGYAPLRFLI